MAKSKFIKIFFVALILFSGLALSLINEKKGSQEKELVMNVKDYIIKSFVSELPEINSKLPHKIDENTILLSIDYTNGKVISRFELLNYKAQADSGQNQINQTVSSLKNKACSDELRKTLLDVDVEFLDRYQDSKGLMIFEVPVNRSMCLELMSFK